MFDGFDESFRGERELFAAQDILPRLTHEGELFILLLFGQLLT